MNLTRLRSTAFITCTAMAAFIALAAPARAGSFAATASPQLASATCTFATADLGYFYYEPKSDLSLAWSSEGAQAGNTVMLGNKKPSSALDCFKPQGFGHSYFEYQQYSSGLCLNVAGDSHSAGAYIILWPCVSTANEMFYTLVNGYGIQLQSESSGLCVYLKSGLNVYSILEQEPCYPPGVTLQEFYAASS
jgi:Ricin-type beta-trefoil lectin domain-like